MKFILIAVAALTVSACCEGLEGDALAFCEEMMAREAGGGIPEPGDDGYSPGAH